jgi:hypothetical protein
MMLRAGYYRYDQANGMGETIPKFEQVDRHPRVHISYTQYSEDD